MSESRITIELNPRERRLYDRIRARITAPNPGAASGFRDLILLLPDLTVLMARLLRDSRVPLSAKAVALVGVGYVLSPVDLLPEVLLGPIGLADDLLVVGATCSRLLNHVHPDVVRSHWSGQGDVLDAVRRISAWAEAQFTERWRVLWRWLQGARSAH